MKRQSILITVLVMMLILLFPLSVYAQEEEDQTIPAATVTEEALLENEANEILEEDETEAVTTTEEVREETEVIVSEDVDEDLSVSGNEAFDDSGLQAQSGSVAVYRLYYPGNGEHLYTTDVNEKNTLYNNYGWGYEGIAWYASTSGTPVYRLYQPGLGNHLYTMDANEVKTLTSKYGWKKDNGGKALFYSSGSVPIYRVYNKNQSGMHHLTTDYNEYTTLPKYGWTKEGVKIYASQIGSPITTTYSAKTNLSRAKSAYKTIVNQNKTTNVGGTAVYQSYYLHDLNSDGIPELLLKLGVGAANSHGVAYTYDTSKNKAVNIGTFMTSHTHLYYGNSSRSSGSIRIDFFHQGNYVQYKLSMSGQSLSQTPVLSYTNYYSTLPSNYGELTEYSTNNLTPLN